MSDDDDKPKATGLGALFGSVMNTLQKRATGIVAPADLHALSSADRLARQRAGQRIKKVLDDPDLHLEAADRETLEKTLRLAMSTGIPAAFKKALEEARGRIAWGGVNVNIQFSDKPPEK